MANPTWPISLPPIPQPWQDQRRFPGVQSVTQAGPGKVRRRYSAMATDASGSISISGQQRQTLDIFVETTLRSVLPFDWEDPQDDSVATYRFKAFPSYTLEKGHPDPLQRRYRAVLPLEKLP